MIFNLLIFILIINLICLSFNFYPLLLSKFINNTIFYVNIVVFLIYIFHKKKYYGIDNSNFSFSIFFPILLILFYFSSRYFNVLSKPFSDFFGYLIIKLDTNNLLNKKKKDLTIVNYIIHFLKLPFDYIISLFKKHKPLEYLSSSNEEYYENNWKKFINSIPFEGNGIDKKSYDDNKENPTIELKTVSEVDELYDRGVKIQYGGKKKSLSDKIVNILFDVSLEKRRDIIENIIKQAEKDIDINKLINLLDRKFMVSKIIWLIIIVIITQSLYGILIIRK